MHTNSEPESWHRARAAGRQYRESHEQNAPAQRDHHRRETRLGRCFPRCVEENRYHEAKVKMMRSCLVVYNVHLRLARVTLSEARQARLTLARTKDPNEPVDFLIASHWIGSSTSTRNGIAANV